MFQSQGKHVLKVATIREKNMLPIGSIFFPLIVAPMRVENNLKGIKLKKNEEMCPQNTISL